MRSDHEFIAGGKGREDYLEILGLASGCTEDEFQNITYQFDTPVGTVVLCDSTNDGDISIEILVPTQKSPLVKIDLAGCREIRAIKDKRGKYLEFVGQLKWEQYSREITKTTTGFRLHLEPSLCVEPFFTSAG